MATRKRTKGQTTQWPQEKELKDKHTMAMATMATRKRTKGQTTQWPQEKELKDKQHNGHKKKN